MPSGHVGRASRPGMIILDIRLQEGGCLLYKDVVNKTIHHSTPLSISTLYHNFFVSRDVLMIFPPRVHLLQFSNS